MLRILHNTKIDFIRLWKPAAIGIALFVLPGLLWVAISNFRYSIEFTGGTLMQLEFQQPPDVGAVRSAITEGGLGNAEIATFGTNELIIRAQGTEEIEAQGGNLVIERSVEEGKQMVEAKPPVVVTVSKDIGEPRYPSFMGIRKASKAEIPVWSLNDLGVSAPESVVTRTEVMNPPARDTNVEIITGESPAEIADKLADKILAEKVL